MYLLNDGYIVDWLLDVWMEWRADEWLVGWLGWSMEESVGAILVSRMEWRRDVLDGWKCGSMESWMIIWMDIMNILQISKEVWRCEQLQKNF